MYNLQPCSIIITRAEQMARSAVYDGAILEARSRRMTTLDRLSERYEECKSELDVMKASGSNDKARMKALLRIIANLDELLARENMRNEIIARTHTNMFQR